MHITAFFLTIACASPASLAADPEELEGSMSLLGNRVFVHAQKDDRSPAARAPVRLVKAGQIIQQGETDEKGDWIAIVETSGAHEIWLGAGPDDSLTKMPFSMNFAPPEPDESSGAPILAPVDVKSLPICCRTPLGVIHWELFPWSTAGPGIGLLVLAVVGYYALKSRA